VKALTESILASGEVSGRPALGITVGEISIAAREHYQLPEGLFIRQVNPGSDCMTKGIKAGDILTAVNGTPVTETQHVLDIIEPLGVGDTLVMSIYRDGEHMEFTVELVDMNRVF
jgi:serine protease Do